VVIRGVKLVILFDLENKKTKLSLICLELCRKPETSEHLPSGD